MRVLEKLQPERVFYYFEEITRIPHGSGNVRMISDYLVSFAKTHDLMYVQDDTLTVTIKKSASKGRENEKPIILQGHMDMVAVKTADSVKDLETEGLDIFVEGDLIGARGTSLGADDGIAVAYCLAILEAEDLSHPPIEVIFTTDEETGMDGAIAYDATILQGHRMINIDTEDEGVFVASCAGGAGVICTFSNEKYTRTGTQMNLRLKGFRGGHSGQDIGKNRYNATSCLARILHNIAKEIRYDLIYLYGGEKDNAIPQEADAKIMIDAGDADRAAEIAGLVFDVIKEEAGNSEPDCRIEIEFFKDASAEVFDNAFAADFIGAINVIPVGVVRMNPEIPTMVQTSLNLGKVRTIGNTITAGYYLRSSVESELVNLIDRITTCVELAGGTWKTEGFYPGWAYRSESALRDKMLTAYKEVCKKEGEVCGIHAGLECGVFASKITDLDVVSFGPNMQDIHTTNERLSISSVNRMWKFLVRTLEII